MAKVAVITGCSSGLGRAVAVELAGQLQKDLKPAYKIYAAARKIGAMDDLKSSGIVPVLMDVTSTEDCKRAMKEIEAVSGQIDLLICNAGIAATAPLLEQDIEDVSRIFQTNTLGVLRCIQAVAPGMVKRRHGRIVVVGSITAFLASPFNGAYAASKAALHTMTETLSMELQPFGIGVTEVWAGTFKTDINAKVSTSVERYSLPTSAYQPIAGDIKERAEILEREPKQMAPRRVAKDIVQSVLKKSPPRYVKTGTGVGLYTFLGYLQSFVCPGSISTMLQDKFGLKKLQQIIAESKAAK